MPKRTAVIEIENIWIPLSDGADLAARIWLPEEAESNPVPALLEYLPYRKNDGTAGRDARNHPYLAEQGYACVRVDMRGSGDSGGILYDEYLPQELDDALEVLQWIAAQPWCDGNIGMFGISWGGFNALQVAARRPPELKAIITVCSTDDRYADDVHYMGGCVLGSEMLAWASVMLAYNARPPDPRFVGERWREMWLERMEKTPPFIEAWLSHQRRDAYWQHGSVCEDYAAINIPVYVVGGWADGYTNAVPRLLAGLICRRKGLIGPWAHLYPHRAVPGPVIGFLQESVRWWDQWLKGIDTGIMDEPMLRVWVQDSKLPAAFHNERPGRWLAEPAWPAPGIVATTYYLNTNQAENSLTEIPDEERELLVNGRLNSGLDSGRWCAYGFAGDFPIDQQASDGRSLTFTTAPLEDPLTILGHPEVTLSLAVSQPEALLAVRLCDIAPTGESTQVSYGLLNLTHRDGHEQPTPLQPGRRYEVQVSLNMAGHCFLAGHRLRVAITPTYWPHAWPSPEIVNLQLYTGAASCLHLPVRPSRPEDSDLPPFLPAESAQSPRAYRMRRLSSQRTKHVDMGTGKTELRLVEDYGRVRLPNHHLEHEHIKKEIYTLFEGDPLSACVEIEHATEFKRGSWQIRIETESKMTADATHFYVSNLLDACEGNTRVFTKSWTFKIPRDLV